MKNKKITVFFAQLSNVRGSHDLLTESAMRYSSLSSDELTVLRDAGRKPCFDKHPEIHFSVSHSGSCWVCAFSDVEVGIDFQLHGTTRHPLEIAKRFFHPDEFSAVSKSGDINCEFYRIWSRKEAAVKLCGIGIDRNFSGFDASGDFCEILGRRMRLTDLHLPTEENHSACIACEFAFDTEVIDLP